MTRTSEARFWQTIGAAIGITGGFLLAYDMGRFGLASIDSKALLYGMMASFLILAGGACYIAGRALHVEDTPLTSHEAGLWKTLATVCIVAGAVVVVGAWRQTNDLILDRLAMCSAGAFSMMFGVICLVGQRVMVHMHGALSTNKSTEKAVAIRA
jgi:hypothetical protein